MLSMQLCSNEWNGAHVSMPALERLANGANGQRHGHLEERLTNLLLLQSGHVAAQGAEAAELRILAYHPFNQFSQGQQQGAPVLRVAFQTISATRKTTNV
jgi:hypothetical protein